MFVSKWVNVNVCSLTIALLFYLEIWCDVPPVCHSWLSYQLLSISIRRRWNVNELSYSLRLYDLQPGTRQHLSFPLWGWRQRKMATMMTQFFNRYSMTLDPWGRTDCNSGIQQLKLTRQFSKWRVVNLMAGQLPDWVFQKHSQGTNSSSKESICWSTGVGALPPTMTQARISVLKRGKDPRKRESFLSLLCCCEILTKVIAWRLELVMHTVTQNRLALL